MRSVADQILGAAAVGRPEGAAAVGRPELPDRLHETTRELRRALDSRVGPSSKPSSEPSSCATGLAPDPPCKCTPFAPTVCLTTPPQRRSVVVKQSLGMAEQQQGESGAIRDYGCGANLGPKRRLIEKAGSRTNNGNQTTAWSEAAATRKPGSTRNEDAGASRALRRHRRTGSWRWRPRFGVVRAGRRRAPR
jgi:hypothetical protein